MADGCIFCNIVADIDNPTRICEFKHSVALLCFDQDHYEGYSLLLLKEHYDHTHDLPVSLLHAFVDERALLVKAIMYAFPEVTRINYANYGNVVNHVHEHIIPRCAGDTQHGGPPLFVKDPIHRTDDEYRAMAAKICAALKQL